MIALIRQILTGLAGAFLYWTGWQKAKTESALEEAEGYAKTRKDMDDAQVVPGNDPDAARRWLHERADADKR